MRKQTSLALKLHYFLKIGLNFDFATTIFKEAVVFVGVNTTRQLQQIFYVTGNNTLIEYESQEAIIV